MTVCSRDSSTVMADPRKPAAPVIGQACTIPVRQPTSFPEPSHGQTSSVFRILLEEGEVTEWHKTACVLCAQNCGLEVQVENNRIVKVRAGKENLRSQGYICRKGQHVNHYQHHSERLLHPLKRVGNDFERISWDQAIDEIAEKLETILDAHGPRSYAYMGGGGQGAHLEGLFGRTLLGGLGSKYHYTALAQELTGLFWAWKQATGHQFLISDHHNTDVLLALGWNGMMSHQIPQARTFLKRFAKDPDKVLVVIDPRPSKTAKIADIHLPIRPGTDALLTKAMIAIVLQEGWEDRDYIADTSPASTRSAPGSMTSMPRPPSKCASWTTSRSVRSAAWSPPEDPPCIPISAY